MTTFLSPEWIDEVDRTLRDAATASIVAPIVVEQLVTGSPHGDVRFHVRIGPDGGWAREGPADAPDLRITVDFDTAVALFRGHTNAQHALIAGRMKLGGDLELLAHRAGELTGIADLLTGVRAGTTFPE